MRVGILIVCVGVLTTCVGSDRFRILDSDRLCGVSDRFRIWGF